MGGDGTGEKTGEAGGEGGALASETRPAEYPVSAADNRSKTTPRLEKSSRMDPLYLHM
jgi:hypothetical protein